MNVARPDGELRTGKIAFIDKERVLRSPYYKCNKLWDSLNSDIQSAENIFEFKAR